jgi:hypothetical protein
MKTVSWVLLTLVGTLMLLGGLASASVAYRGAQERIAGVELRELASGREEVVTALRARRGTAAAYAAGFATLFLFVVLGPYRRGEIWSWWAVLVATLVLTLLSRRYGHRARRRDRGLDARRGPLDVLLARALISKVAPRNCAPGLCRETVKPALCGTAD